MLSDPFVAELRSVFQAQHDLLRRADAALDALAPSLTASADHAAALRELERRMDAVEAGDLRSEDFAVLDDPTVRRARVDADLKGLGFTDWASFVRSCGAYDLSHGLDPLAPYEMFLSAADREHLRATSFEQQHAWDRWDYLAVGVSGTLAALVDLLLIRVPRTMTYGGDLQAGSPLTAWLKRYEIYDRDDWFARWARHLEKTCHAPYDVTKGIPGMTGKSHRFQSLGHDPVLGFVFGVVDLMRSTLTGFSYDHLLGRHTFIVRPIGRPEAVGLIEAFLIQIGHLVSDVATRQGLPAPLMPLAQLLNVGSFGPKGRTVAQIARFMYIEGYDLRHYLVGGLGPGIVEATLRAFVLVRHFAEHGEVRLGRASDPKVRSLLLAGHAVAAAANAGKVVLLHGNPLAINVPQWMALVRYLVPSVKYWAFDRHALRLAHLERLSDEDWRALEASTGRLMEVVAAAELPVMTLG